MKDYLKIIASGTALLAVGLIWLGISMTINPQASSSLMFVAIVIGLGLVGAGIEEIIKERKRRREVPDLVKRARQEKRSLRLKWPDSHSHEGEYWVARLGESDVAILREDLGRADHVWQVKERLLTDDELSQMILSENIEVK